ncbi:MAG: CDP-alcohol phosphatidyltransferase family protein [Salinarimonas sp.]|nr:CDP-alcohol phosphatidyltransferase family protein [Salinarimonas sp.]
MLDGMMRRLIDPVLDRVAQRLVMRGIGANTVTFTGFALGLVSALGVVVEADAAALLALVLSRLCDGLDGAVARRTRATDRGGYMDIVLDFAFYGVIPLAFALRDPQANAIPAVVLLFTFYVNGASFLAFSAVAAKRGMDSKVRGLKSIYFTIGLAEGTETIIAFAAMMLFPAHFALIAYFFAGLVAMTALSRLTLAWTVFRDDPEEDEAPTEKSGEDGEAKP